MHHQDVVGQFGDHAEVLRDDDDGGGPEFGRQI